MLQEPLKCILRRIFRVFNRSRTLALSDEELNEFQVHMFVSFQSSILVSIRACLLQRLPT